MEWSPQEGLLHQCILLLQALYDPSRHDHRAAMDSLKKEIYSPDFVLHLLHIFSRGYESQLMHMGLNNDLRQLSGLVLKNYSFAHFGTFPHEVQILIEKWIHQALSDTVPDVRKTACILIGRIAASFPIHVWTQLYSTLVAQLDSTQHIDIDGALSALKLICEDACDKIINGADGALLTPLLPKLLALFRSPEQVFRLHSLQTVIVILGFAPVSVSPIPLNTSVFIQELSVLATDTSPEVRKCVCEAVCLLAANDLASLEKYFSSLCEFMLHATGDVDESVALEACEFWSTLAMSHEGQEGLKPYLPRLIPLLISRMRLTENQITLDRIEEEEHASGERSLNMKPLHHRAKGDDDDDDDDDDGGEVTSTWTIRRQSAAVFDNISVVFSSDLVLPYALSAISSLLPSTDVWDRECGMLALGALSRGCQEDLTEFVPQILPHLLENMVNTIPELRSIACWTLGRFCYMIIDQENAQVGNENLGKLLQVIVAVMLDPKPKVQSAACSALCTLIEEAGDRIKYFVQPILVNVGEAFKVYGVKNALLLCDTIGTLADNIGADLAHPQLTALYLPQLMKTFDAYDDVSMHLFPIMECLTSVVAVIGTEFNAYAYSTFTRCLRIINNTMAANAVVDAGLNPNSHEAPPKDFAICALDVISSLAEGLGPSFAGLIQGNENNVLEQMFGCMKDSMDAVRQSAFSLAGDLSKSCTELLLPVKAQLFTLAVGNLDPDVPMVCNNASWTIGELAIRMDGHDMAPFIPKVMQNLIHAVHKVAVLPTSLKQNIAITIGRLCVTNTDACAELLPEFFVNWCRALRTLEPSVEQDHAFTGLCAAVSSNPVIFSIAGSFDAFILACASLSTPPEEPLHSNISNILRALLSVSESSWRALMATHRREVEHLNNLFRLSS